MLGNEPPAKRPKVRTPALAPHLTGGTTAAATAAPTTSPWASTAAGADPLGGLFAGLPEAATDSVAPLKEKEKIPETHKPVTQVRVLHLLKKHTESRRPSSWREKVIKRTVEEATYELKELRKKMASIEDKAKLREEFERHARKESDCSSHEHGGDLGKFGRGKMQPAFEQAAFALKINELSNVVSTDSGMHLILRLE